MSESPGPITGPQSEDQWTIHALNIHGLFLERYCQHILNTTPGWNLTTTNYPVAIHGHESTLDIRGDFLSQWSRLILLVECKKNNPDFVNWIFFPKYPQSGRIDSSFLLPGIRTFEGETVKEYMNSFTVPLVTASEARETRGNYLAITRNRSDKTKTANNAITDAASQISLASEAIQGEEVRRAWAFVRAHKSPLHVKTTLLPTIVTR